jgi:hypothetical protein
MLIDAKKIDFLKALKNFLVLFFKFEQRIWNLIDKFIFVNFMTKNPTNYLKGFGTFLIDLKIKTF